LAINRTEDSQERDPLDWPTWRGPRQDRTSLETGLIDQWDPNGGKGSNLLWKNTELGGRSTPIVLRGKLYTIVRDKIGTPNEGAKVICVDAATGKKHWQYRYNIYLSDVPDTRVGWSSCTGDPATGRIYVQTVSGYFCCLEGDTGKLVWSRSLHEEFGLLSTYGGRTNVPLVYEDLVLVSAIVIGWGDSPKWGSLAIPAHRFMAFDKATGQLRWLRGTRLAPYDTTYSTPTISLQGGQEAMVFGSGDGAVWAMQPRTGMPIWKYPFSRRGLNISPLVVDQRIYTSHSEENLTGNTMGALVALEGNQEVGARGLDAGKGAAGKGDPVPTAKPLWQQLTVMAGKSSPVMVDGRLWIVDDRAKLQVIDPGTGRLIARKALGTVMRSTPLVADGKVYLCTNNGRWYVLKPTASGVQIIHKKRLSGQSSDGSPIVSHGRIYLPTSEAIYCLAREDLGSKDLAPPIGSTHSPATPPDPLEENTHAGVARGDDRRQTQQVATQLQVVPYDALLAPGEQLVYTIRLYNARGQFLRTVAAPDRLHYSLEGPGTITANGTYTAPLGDPHRATRVVCRLGELEGSARLRVVPPLPWHFDFNTAEKIPLTWIGGRVRYVLREVDGEQVAAKRSVLPTPRNPKNKLGTRSRLWMGPIHLSNYTVQADIRLTQTDGKLPDVGLINSRYTMTLRGMNRQLRLYSWSPHDYRSFAASEFEPQPEVWYTMKFSVTPKLLAEGEDPQAIVQGKLWLRDEQEPTAWTVEMVDHAANLSGSPGLYGNAQEAEFYIDNIHIVSNEEPPAP
jgi:outer membrane protein assembly factor BamB